MDILKKECKGNYTGYELKEIYISNITRRSLEIHYVKLKLIPYKISYFLHIEKIKDIFKAGRDIYFVISTNNKIYELVY